jgi:hypothetical protein
MAEGGISRGLNPHPIAHLEESEQLLVAEIERSTIIVINLLSSVETLHLRSPRAFILWKYYGC